MRLVLLAGALLASMASTPSTGVDAPARWELHMPALSLDPSLNQAVDELSLSVTCGHIVQVERIPDLWNLEIRRGTSAVEEFEASAGLGTMRLADPQRLDGVISIEETDPSCFDMTGRIVVSGSEPFEVALSKQDLRPARAEPLSSADRAAMALALIRHELATPRSYLASNRALGPFFVSVGEADPDDSSLASLKDSGLDWRPGSEWKDGKGMRVSIGEPEARANGDVEVTHAYYCGMRCSARSVAVMRKVDGRWTVVESELRMISHARPGPSWKAGDSI